MTQDSVYKLLKKRKREMSTKEIAKILDLSTSSVSHALNGLLGGGSVVFSYRKEKIFMKFWKAI